MPPGAGRRLAGVAQPPACGLAGRADRSREVDAGHRQQAKQLNDIVYFNMHFSYHR
jgi:hypothetical protein